MGRMINLEDMLCAKYCYYEEDMEDSKVLRTKKLEE
jgi:hypothetical protein